MVYEDPAGYVPDAIPHSGISSAFISFHVRSGLVPSGLFSTPPAFGITAATLAFTVNCTPAPLKAWFAASTDCRSARSVTYGALPPAPPAAVGRMLMTRMGTTRSA